MARLQMEATLAVLGQRHRYSAHQIEHEQSLRPNRTNTEGADRAATDNNGETAYDCICSIHGTPEIEDLLRL